MVPSVVHRGQIISTFNGVSLIMKQAFCLQEFAITAFALVEHSLLVIRLIRDKEARFCNTLVDTSAEHFHKNTEVSWRLFIYRTNQE